MKTSCIIKSISIFFVTCLILLDAAAQNQQDIDSLLNMVESVTLSEIEKVDAFNNIARLYSDSDSTNTITYANRAIDIAGMIGYKEGIIDANHAIAWLFVSMGYHEEALDMYMILQDRSKAIKYLEGEAKIHHGLSTLSYLAGNYKQSLDYEQQALTIAEEHDLDDVLVGVINGMGMAHSALGNKTKALEYYLKSIRILEKLDDKIALSRILNNMGEIYIGQGDFSKGLEYLLRGLKLVEKMGNENEAASIYVNIALVYNLQEDNQKSLEYLFKALDVWEKSEYSYGLAFTYRGIGTIYQEQKNYEQSIDYLFKSIRLDEEINNVEGLADSYGTIGLIYEALNDYSKALDYSQKSLDISKKNGNKEFEIKALINLGKICYKENKLSKAKNYLKKGIQLAKEIEYPISVRDGMEQLALVEQKLKNFKAALLAHQQFKLMEDSLKNEENTKSLTRLETEYVFEQEKDSIEFANKVQIQAFEAKEEAANLKLLFITIVAILIISIGLVIASGRIRFRKQQTEQLKAVGKFKETMTGMIAHDLKNPLSVIINSTAEIPSTKHMAGQMLHLVNNMLDVHKFESTEVELNVETLNVSILCNNVAEQVRPLLSEKNIKLDLQVEPNLNILADNDLLIRVLVNLLTNAIKYSEFNSSIELSTKKESGKVRISIQDFGKGIPAKDIDRLFASFEQLDPKESGGVGSTGLGLTFCKLAIEAHGSDIKVASEVGNGTAFSFLLECDVTESAGVHSHENQTYTFVISESQRNAIIDKLPALKAMKIYQVSEIEELLSEMSDSEKEHLDDWIKALLNAAYSNNQAHYDELINQLG